jgi:hypothetical protein
MSNLSEILTAGTFGPTMEEILSQDRWAVFYLNRLGSDLTSNRLKDVRDDRASVDSHP